MIRPEGDRSAMVNRRHAGCLPGQKRFLEEVKALRNPGQRLGVWSKLVTLPTLLSVALISCGGASNNPSSTSLNDDMTGTITVAYSTTYVFDSDDTSVIWWDKVKKEFEAAYPKAKLNLQGFNGTDVDLVNKVALEYKNPSTTPDVFMLPTGYVGQWVGSDYLLPLDSFVTDSSKAPFWKSFPKVIQEGLCGSTSGRFSPKAVGRPVVLLKDHQMAIAIGSNWFADAWTEQNRHWATAAQEASAVPLPTSKGQAPGSASTLGGWAVSISKVTKHPQLSWGLIKVIQSDDNQTYIANRAGFVPPSQTVAHSDGFLNFAPPFNKAFGDTLPNSKLVPSEQEGYPAWVQGIGQATGQIATDPNTSVDAAIKILHDTVANQVGADKVETLK